jgi:hypothetical protein
MYQFNFPIQVQPLLKLQKIKPHWMFTLDDLIRNAVQQALRLLKPVEPMMAQTSEEHFQHMMALSTNQHQLQSQQTQQSLQNFATFPHHSVGELGLGVGRTYSEQIKMYLF